MCKVHTDRVVGHMNGALPEADAIRRWRGLAGGGALIIRAVINTHLSIVHCVEKLREMVAWNGTEWMRSKVSQPAKLL